VALLALSSPFFGLEFTVFMLSMSIVHTFVDFIPSVFLGAPSSDTFEGVLPAHKLFLEGKAFEATCLTVFGGIIALIGGALISPLFFLFIVESSEAIILFTPVILIFSLIVLILSESTKKKMLIALFVVLAAGGQGMLFSNQIFPLITGYFGIPTIVYSLKDVKRVEQIMQAKIELGRGVDALVGLIGGAIVSVIPGIGNNVASGIIRVFKNIKSENYLVLLGSINTSNFFFSYAVLFALSKTRNGVMISLKEKIFFTPESFYIGVIVMVFAGLVGAIITLLFALKASKFFSKQKALLFSILSIVVMILSVFIFNGPLGIITLIFSSALGFFVLFNKVKRSCCMASLIIPALFFYVFILI